MYTLVSLIPFYVVNTTTNIIIYIFVILDGLELFKGFLKSEFSEENLEFWIACEEFRFAVDSKLPIAAQKIYGDFVAFQAPKEVNIYIKLQGEINYMLIRIMCSMNCTCGEIHLTMSIYIV